MDPIILISITGYATFATYLLIWVCSIRRHPFTRTE
jgi:hypothetical protein